MRPRQFLLYLTLIAVAMVIVELLIATKHRANDNDNSNNDDVLNLVSSSSSSSSTSTSIVAYETMFFSNSSSSRPRTSPSSSSSSTSATLSSTSTTSSSTLPSCNPSSIFNDLLHRFRLLRVQLIVLELKDFLESLERNLTANVLSAETVVSRFGIFADDEERVMESLNEGLVISCAEFVKVVKLKEGPLLTNIFVIVDIASNVIPTFISSNPFPLPYYEWKRLHIRILHRRGRPRSTYFWAGPEPDDDGNFKIPAEAFEEFQLEPIHDRSDPEGAPPLFYAPKNFEYFHWQRGASEFKACDKNRARRRGPGLKSRRLRDEREIWPYMKSIVALDKLLKSIRIRPWLNCGTLLGWWRQCSIIPRDPDVDLLQWNSMDHYPRIMREILRRPREFRMLKAKLDYGPFPQIHGKQEGFYIKVLVKGGKTVDLYFNYERKIYDTRHHHGTVDSMDFTDNVCSADLHGFLVHVPCSDKKIDEYLRLYFGEDYMNPR